MNNRPHYPLIVTIKTTQQNKPRRMSKRWTCVILITLTTATLTNNPFGIGVWNIRHVAIHNLLATVTPPAIPALLCLLAYRHSTKTISLCAVGLYAQLTNLLPQKKTHITAIYQTLNTGLENSLAVLHPTSLILAIMIQIVAVFITSCDSRVAGSGCRIQKKKIPLAAAVLISTALSCWWANQELFWGYYWNWDPVEMTTILLILTYAAATHKLIKNTLLWDRNLVLLLYGTAPVLYFLLNKSYVAQSVHAFSGAFFLAIGYLTASLLLVTAIISYLVVSVLAAYYPKCWDYRSVSRGNSFWIFLTPLFLYSTTAVISLVTHSEEFTLTKTKASDLFTNLTTGALVLAPNNKLNNKGHQKSSQNYPPHHSLYLCTVIMLTAPWFNKQPNLYQVNVVGTKVFELFWWVGEAKTFLYGNNWRDAVYTHTNYTGLTKTRHTITQQSYGNNKCVVNYFKKNNTNLSFVTFCDKVIKPTV